MVNCTITNNDEVECEAHLIQLFEVNLIIYELEYMLSKIKVLV